MKKHIETRHLKGGEATKLKYQSRWKYVFKRYRNWFRNS
jgi:hypothetical protein